MFLRRKNRTQDEGEERTLACYKSRSFRAPCPEKIDRVIKLIVAREIISRRLKEELK